MANPNLERDKPDGAAFDDYFDSIGKKAENLSLRDHKPATNATVTTLPTAEVDEPKVVDEIESLCMNCHDNV